ncbi:MAG: 30S ribosomal protein S13 [Candidatus Aenigmatarchaeota archaeon]
MGVTRVKDPYKTKRKIVKKPKKEKPKKIKKAIEGVRGIVRIAEKDLDGQKKVRIALLGVKGIGKTLAWAIPNAAGIDPEIMLGKLSEEDVKKLEDAVRSPEKYGIPVHMLNRRIDPETGENKHIVSSELVLTRKFDIDILKKIRSYRGIRHELGLPVRGQRTRSSFRKGAIVGVSRKKAREAQKKKKK